MSLLREIQDTAIDSRTELAVLLRKCKVLAARLGNPEFKQWVECELSGYDDIDDLPDYRVLTVNSKGHFSGPFQSGLRNADIPLMCINEKLRKNLTHSYLNQGVASMESLVNDASGGTLQEPWNPDLVAYVGQDIYEGMNCMQAWKVIPVTGIVAALDAVRNRILNFVLEIEAESPDAGEAPVNSNPVPQDKVHQIFNTYISGNVQNVATGSRDFEQHAINNDTTPEVFSQLIEALESVRGEPAYDAAKSSVIEMQECYGADSFKSKYQNFMSALADHMQVLGPLVAPYLPALAALVP
ncbi:hypothetical protein KOI40_00365 [Aestuariicella sp. G3-2]|uniref:AbiTii domain-containing protein n=1 Tax=Pseudomaricurvus albidus TaxID=2842452 RepID=UPI001C0D7352|nr:hypothetical protein [Aestuariicella albida]MBU3068267.1 hypothetical protein [Aestuariicella albida]